MMQLMKKIEDKVYSGARLNRVECIELMNSADIHFLGRMADHVRRKKVGDKAFFSMNLNINYTNKCESMCPLCAFSKERDDESSYIMPLDEIEEKVRRYARDGLFEVHIVGGLCRDIEFSYFEEMLRRIKRIDPDIQIQAFTAVEIAFFSDIYIMPVGEIIERLKKAGLGSIPGGGAEMFNPDIRKILCPDKISGKRWLDIMETAHSLGLSTNATMLYGHIESFEDRVDHLLALRDLQDRTNGFMAFVPLAFHSHNTRFDFERTMGVDDIRVIAASRIILDNFQHIKALWMYSDMKMMQVVLSYGADDIGGISLEEKIVHAAGARTPEGGDKEELKRLIIDAGRDPVMADSVYAER